MSQSAVRLGRIYDEIGPDEGLTLTTATREISLSHAAVLASILTGGGTSR